MNPYRATWWPTPSKLWSWSLVAICVATILLILIWSFLS